MKENFERQQIPQNQKRGWFAMLSVLVAIGVDLSSVLLGSDLAMAMPMDEAIWSVVLGSGILAIMYTLCAIVGAKTGLTAALITEYVFGSKVAKVFALAICLSLLGWFGVQVGFFAENIQVVFSELFGLHIDVWVFSLIGGILMTSTAIVGYRAIEKLSVYSVPFLLILMLVTAGLAFYANGTPVNGVEEQTMTMFDGASLCISILIVGAITAPDISRWSKSVKECTFSSFFGVLIGNSFMIIISIILVKVMGTGDIMQIFLALGLAIPGIFILTLAQWTTNTTNVYSSALGASVVFKKVSPKILSIIVGAIGTLLAVLGIYNNFISFLSLLAIVIAPVGGIYVAEFYICKRRLKDLKGNSKLALCSSIIWLLSAAFTYLVTPAPDGLQLFTVTTIAPLDGFAFAFLLQAVAGKLLQKKLV